MAEMSHTKSVDGKQMIFGTQTKLWFIKSRESILDKRSKKEQVVGEWACFENY